MMIDNNDAADDNNVDGDDDDNVDGDDVVDDKMMMMVPDLKGGLEKITAFRLLILFKAITAISVPIE